MNTCAQALDEAESPTNTRIPPIILAIDPGTRRVGWCVGQGGRYVSSDTLHLGSGDVWERLGRLVNDLRELVERYAPDVIACELPTGNHGNRATDRKIGAAFGVVLALASVSGVAFLSVHAMKVKATGYGKGNLAHTGLLIGKTLDKNGEDEADAAGVWQAALRMLWECEKQVS